MSLLLLPRHGRRWNAADVPTHVAPYAIVSARPGAHRERDHTDQVDRPGRGLRRRPDALWPSRASGWIRRCAYSLSLVVLPLRSRFSDLRGVSKYIWRHVLPNRDPVALGTAGSMTFGGGSCIQLLFVVGDARVHRELGRRRGIGLPKSRPGGSTPSRSMAVGARSRISAP